MGALTSAGALGGPEPPGLPHYGRPRFIHISSEGDVPSLYVLLDSLERDLSHKLICLIYRVGRRPIHGPPEHIHFVRGQLELATPGLALSQLLDVLWL